MISARSSHRSINLLHSAWPVVITRRGRIVKCLVMPTAAAACCLLVLPAAVCSVHTGLGSPCDWQAKMRRCLLEIDWQQHGQLWLCLVVVRCCCSLLLLVVVVVLHQCCNEQCLHYKAQCVNAMHACACPDTVQTLRLPDRQTVHARTQPLTHATRGVEEEAEGAQTTAI